MWSDVNAILIGLDGQVDKIKLMSGAKDEHLPPWVRKAKAELAARKGVDVKGKPRVMTPQMFDAMFTNPINKGQRKTGLRVVVKK